jgi:RNA polymerase sigma-70 factor (ECF subfamily)
MGAPNRDATDVRDSFNRLLAELRPKLHRYCARMTGSVIDGEDVLQEALADAIASFPADGTISNPEGWLFRVAYTTALDFLRRRARHRAAVSEEDPDLIVDPVSTAQDREIAAASLHTFMHLPVGQRSSVILMDVLGYSLQEICAITTSSLPAVKAALHRGRVRLRELAREQDDRPRPVLAEPERARLAAYVARFNARDFDTLRDMLAEDVRLDLVARRQLQGREDVKEYFHQYARVDQWQMAAGFVDRRPAVLAYDRSVPAGRPAFFILLDWRGEELVDIRDFLFARYAIEGAEVIALE